MSDIVSTVREQPLPQLEPFCRALAQSLRQAGMTPGQAAEAFRIGLDAECVRCGIRVWGEELFALSQPPSADYGNVKLGRLRLGYCAREGCESFVYRLTLWNSSTLDWRAVIPQAESIQSRQQEEVGPQIAAGPQIAVLAALRRAAHSNLAHRVALGLAIGAVLLLAWQWRRGGRIPILREPEQFRVTIAPRGEE